MCIFGDIKKRADEIISSNNLTEAFHNDSFKPIIDGINSNTYEKIKSISVSIADNFRNNVASSIENIVVCGTGGSNLAAKAFSSLHNFEIGSKKIFFLENLDQFSISHTLNKINPNSTFFFFISKSGSTLETTLQVHYIINWIKLKAITNLKYRMAIITTPNIDSDLTKIAKDNDLQIFSWEENIGGRFSAFSINTLLPIALFGINIQDIVLTARNHLKENILNKNSDPIKSGIINHLMYAGSKNINVIMPYSDQLSCYVAWYKQLWSESVGKDGYGTTPMLSIGMVDQHSMLQAYLDGNDDKYFTLIKLESSDHLLKCSIKNSNLIKEGGDISFVEVMKISCESTALSLFESGKKVKVISINEVSEKLLSCLMVDAFLETLCSIHLANKYLDRKINAFNQPSVEKSKANLSMSIKKHQK